MKKFVLAALVSLAVICSGFYAGCGSNRGNEDAVQVEAAMMMGRDEARNLIKREWKDTMELQNYILEVRAKQSELVLRGRVRSAEAFDSAFISTLRKENPELARLIIPTGRQE